MNDLLKLASGNISHAKKRSWLTMIGIFIGIAAVVSLVSLGQGLQDAIDEQFQEIGSDKLFISSNANLFGVGGDLASPLTTRDERALRSVRGVEDVTGYVVRSAQMEVGEQLQFNLIAGIPLEEGYDLVRQATTIDVVEGRELRPGDKRNVLVGADYARTEVFDEPVRLGDRIIVNGEKYTVVGILEAIGSPVDDRIVWMPMDAAEELLGITDERDNIIVQVSSSQDPIIVAEDVERALRDERDVREGEEDFNVQTPEDLLAQFGIILTIINVVLLGIASISLIVGGVGIMNTMYTAVLERTKEIGIMKAVGATPRTIQLVFLLESGLLGLIGGAIGIAIGLGIAKTVEIVGSAALNSDFINAHVSWWLILGALAFSTIIGMAAGYFPARQASAQDPVESLRYE